VVTAALSSDLIPTIAVVQAVASKATAAVGSGYMNKLTG